MVNRPDAAADQESVHGRTSLARFAWRLLVLLGRDWPWLVALGGVVLAQVVYYISIPFIFMWVFDKGLPERDQGIVLSGVVLLTLLFVLHTSSAFAQDRIASRLTSRLLRTLRTAAFDKIQSLSSGYLLRTSANRIVTTYSRDTLALEAAVARTLPVAAVDSTFVAAGVVAAFTIDWILATVAFSVVALAAVLPTPLTARALGMGITYRDREAETADYVRESVNLGRVIRAFQLEEVRRRTFQVMADDLARLGLRANRLSGYATTATLSTFGALLIVVIASGSWFVLSGRIEPGAIIGFLILLVSLQAAIDALAKALPSIVAAATGLHRIDALLDERDVMPPLARSAAPEPVRSITFENVTYRYSRSDRTVLKDLSFRIEEGTSVAFVGRSGSGKSTILHLLLGNDRPTTGRILINGTDLSLIDDDRFARTIGLVAQEHGLFDMSIGDNIRLGAQDASEGDIVEAARGASIHEDILRMPDGYDTMVGEGAARLSGGQRQRVAIARALVRRPRLLVLDEVTASLDPLTEHAVALVIEAMHRKATVVAVTHRLAQVTHFDIIFVLSEGEIVEAGTHDELLRANGEYARLWGRQHGLLLSDGGTAARITPERLRDIPLFAGLGPEQAKLVAGFVRSRPVEPGEFVFKDEDRDPHLYIVARGTFDLITTVGDGETAIETASVGDCFGATGLLDGRSRRHAAVRARGPGLLLVLPTDEIAGIMGGEPAMDPQP